MCWLLASRGRLEKLPSNHRNGVAASLGMLRAPWSEDLLEKTLADVAPIPELLVHVHNISTTSACIYHQGSDGELKRELFLPKVHGAATAHWLCDLEQL